MSDLIYPCSVHTVSDSFADHVARGSVNPGTDYEAAYGSPVYAVKSGTVNNIDANNSGSGGRVIHIDHDDGYGSDYLHLSRIYVTDGQHVVQGQVLGQSGASGFGSDWYYGPHLHISYRDNHSEDYSNVGNLDFDALIRAQSASTAVLATPVPIDTQEDIALRFWRDVNGTLFYGAYPIPNMQRYNLLVRYHNSSPEQMDSFNAAERDMILEALKVNGVGA